MPTSTKFSWIPSGNEGTQVYFGTDGSGIYVPHNTINGTDTGYTSSYQVSQMLIGSQTYYLHLVPYNVFGDAIDCPIWNFTVIPSDTVPYCVHFDTYAVPNGWSVSSNPGQTDFWFLTSERNYSRLYTQNQTYFWDHTSLTHGQCKS